MGRPSLIGRIFFGVAVIETGLQTIYYDDFPYWLVPPKHAWIPGISIIAYAAGALLAVAGTGILLKRKAREAGLLLGGVLLLVFCLAHVPYELIAGSNVLSLVEWENAEKELAFACGGFVIAGSISEYRVRPGLRLLEEFISSGSILFALMIMCFGTIHCLYAKEASGYVPTWVPGPVIWMYITGVALLGSGVSIIFKIQTGLIAFLLGAMVFIWFVILHIPRTIVSPIPYLGSEITSAMLALAYSGIAFVIAGKSGKI
ncbi:MAG TPA: hypothetical protein VG737_15885 [Cyclobacteriaceae bacterium]|nr:hypothetical protein [Cyclobacteriaceae bacterium]